LKGFLFWIFAASNAFVFFAILWVSAESLRGRRLLQGGGNVVSIGLVNIYCARSYIEKETHLFFVCVAEEHGELV